MADTTITIPDLGSLTAGQASDLLLATRGTTGYKMLLSDLAKYMVETYNSSSLAGSAQSVKNALDSLNSSAISSGLNGTPIPNNSDLDSYIVPGNYYSSATSITQTLTNCPVNNLAFRLIVFSTGYNSIAYGRQILISQHETWMRYNRDNNTITPNWTAWVKITDGSST